MAARLLLKHLIEEAKHDRKVAEGKAAFSTSTSPPSSASSTGTRVLGRLRLDEEGTNTPVRGKLTDRIEEDISKDSSASKKRKVEPEKKEFVRFDGPGMDAADAREMSAKVHGKSDDDDEMDGQEEVTGDDIEEQVDSGGGSGFEDDDKEQEGEGEGEEEEIELELFADQHEDAPRKAPERLRQPVPNATDQSAFHPYYRFWARRANEYPNPEELDSLAEYAGLHAKDAEFSYEQLTSDSWVRSDQNRKSVLGPLLEDGIECPNHHISTRKPTREDVSECFGAALCSTCTKPCIWRAKAKDGDIVDSNGGVKAKSTPAYSPFAQCVWMTQWTGSQNKDECGGFGGFHEGIRWITQKLRAAQSEFEGGALGHANDAVVHLFASPSHVGSMIVKAHLVSMTYLHVRFDKRETQRQTTIGDFRTAMRQRIADASANDARQRPAQKQQQSNDRDRPQSRAPAMMVVRHHRGRGRGGGKRGGGGGRRRNDRRPSGGNGGNSSSAKSNGHKQDHHQRHDSRSRSRSPSRRQGNRDADKHRSPRRR